MYDYEYIYRLARSKYGERNGLHDNMLVLNKQGDNLTFEQYFSQMKEICKGEPGMYHFYFDKYREWYDTHGINITPKG